MAKLIDYIAIRIVFFIALLIFWYTLTKLFWLSAVISAAVVVGGSLFYGSFISSKIKKERINAERLYRLFLIRGNAYAAEYIAAKIGAEHSPEHKGDYILVDQGGGSLAVVFPIFRFAKISKDDLLRMYRTAEADSAAAVYIISKNRERELSAEAKNLGISLLFIKIPVLYRYLKAKNALPILPAPPPRVRFSLSIFAEAFFCRRNSRRFMFASMALLVTSLITPLKTYYYVMAFVSFLLGLVCLLFPESSGGGKKGIFGLK